MTYPPVPVPPARSKTSQARGICFSLRRCWTRWRISLKMNRVDNPRTPPPSSDQHQSWKPSTRKWHTYGQETQSLPAPAVWLGGHRGYIYGIRNQIFVHKCNNWHSWSSKGDGCDAIHTCHLWGWTKYSQDRLESSRNSAKDVW